MAILEDILHQLTRIANAMETPAASAGHTEHHAVPPSTYTNGALGPQTPATYAQQLQPPMGQLPQPPAQQQQPMQAPPMTNITAEAITGLIQPHVSNPAIKDALGATMRSMGINALPDTQPHQFAELYARFQAVIAQHSGAQQQQAPSPASII